jgi:hypothetical protein
VRPDVAVPPDEGRPGEDVPKADVKVPVDGSPDVRPPLDVVPDVPGDAAPDTWPDVRPDVRSDVLPDVRPDVPRDVPVPDTWVRDVPHGPDCVNENDDICRYWTVQVPPCMERYCNTAAYRCELRAVADGGVCSDGDRCTENDACAAGVCVGEAKDCGESDSCSVGRACDPATGECRPGAPLNCAEVAGNHCSEWVCDPVLGCLQGDAVECSSDPCFGIEHCDPAVGCVQDAPPLCDLGGPCRGWLLSCDRQAAAAGAPGACTYGVGTQCDDGNVCNGAETCDPGARPGDNPCVPGVQLVCDDGNACNGVEDCDPVSGCYIRVPPPDCRDIQPCDGIRTCDPVEGRCVDLPAPCADPDGNVCNGSLACQRRVVEPFYECIPVPPLQCDDGNPCNGVEACDPATGCYPQTHPPNCDDGNFCNGEETCDPATGACVAGDPRECEDGNVCNGVMICHATEGCIPDPFRQPIHCDDGRLCNGTETCDPQTGDCLPGEPLECEDGNICNGVLLCDDDDGCVADPLNPPIDCSNGDACDGVEGCDPLTGECLPGAPLDCDDRNSCSIDTCSRTAGCGHQWLAEGAPCSDGDPCTLDDTCRGNVCVPTHQACLCPADDAREPDDSAAAATFETPPAGVDSLYEWDGVLCGADEDWFGVGVGVGDRVIATLEHVATYGALTLRVEDSAGLVVAIGNGAANVQALDVTAALAGALYAVVSGPGGATFENSYTLTLYVVPEGVCAEDDLEDNDTAGTAVPLLSGQPVLGRICTGDPDWFSVEVRTGQTLTADLVYTPVDAQVALELLDADGALLEVGTGVPGRLRVRLAATLDRTPHIRVTAVGGAQADYSLTARTVASSACIDDFYEENDLQVQGVRVAWGSTTAATLCPNDYDWYLIDLAPGDDIQLALLANPIARDLNVYLHRPASPTGQNGQPVLYGISPDGEELVTYRVPESAPVGLWGIRVLGIGGASADYTLTVSGTGGQVTCQEDAFEPNDAPATGPVLGNGQALAGRRCPSDDDWYRVNLGVGDVLTATLRPADLGDNLDLVIVDPDANEIARGGVPGTGMERLVVTAAKAGAWSLGVVADGVATNSYTLSISVNYAAPPCIEDAYEQNDTRATAAPLTAGTELNAQLCPEDDDWYTFVARSDQRSVLTLRNSAGLTCSVVAADGTPLGTCEPAPGGAIAEVTGAFGPLYVLVSGGAGQPAPYALLLTTSPIVACDDDAFEPDDDLATARAVDDGVPMIGVRCPGDDDWFRFDLAAGEAVSATLASPGDLDLALMLGDEIVIYSAVPGTEERIAFIAPGPLTLALRVTGAPDAMGAYVLTVDLGVFVCTDDAWEPNDTQAEAVLAGDGEEFAGQLCAGDLDWFAVDLASGERLIADLAVFGAGNPLRLYVHRPDGQTVAMGTSVYDHEHLEYVAPSAGRYGLRVFGPNGAENVYLLMVTVVPSVPPCVDDAFDDGGGNDTRETAAPLSLPEPSRELVLYPQVCEGDDDWYAVDVTAGDVLSFTVQSIPPANSLTVQLHDPTGALLGSERTWEGSASVDIPALTTGRYTARVFSEDPEQRSGCRVVVRVTTPHFCPEDLYEQNDDLATAVPVTGSGVPLLAQLCPGDEDWFAITLAKRDELAVLLDFVHLSGNLDLELRGPAGTVVASSATLTDDEQASVVATVAGVYGIRVFAPTSAVENAYALTVTHAPYVCPEDAFEPNDSASAPAAARLVDGQPRTAAVCGDEDWYPFAAQAGEGIVLRLAYDGRWGDLNLQLLAPDRTTVVATVEGGNGQALLQRMATVTGTYLVRVWSPAGGDLEYTLTPGLTAYACTNDTLEPSSAAHPVPLPGNVLRGGMICIGDEDWYTVQVAPGETLIASLVFTHEDGDLALELLRPDGTSAAVSDGVLDSESAAARALVGGLWLVRIFTNVPGTDNAYDLTVSRLPYTCPDDAYEDNDSQAQAWTLTSGQGAEGLICIGDDDWYGVALQACDTLTVEMHYPYAADADLQLALHAPGGTVARTSRSATDFERIIYRAPAAGVYGVRVYPEVGAESSYSLAVSVDPYTCVDDPYEDNDSRATAWTIAVAPLASPGGRHCCNDDDWFTVPVEAGDRLTATLCYDPTRGDLDLALVAADGATLVSSATGVAEHAAWVAQQAGTVAVAVTAAGGVENDYRLWLTRETYVCADDGWEPNDTAGAPAALVLPLGGSVSLPDAVLCSGDEDWYSVVLAAGDLLTVDVRFDHPAACPANPDEQPLRAGHDLDVVVLGPSGLEIAAGRSGDSDELVETMAPLGGSYRIQVASPVFADQDYTATLRRQPFACAEDTFEPNDEFVAARPFVLSAEPVVAWLCDPADWFSFPANAGDTIDVTVAFSHAVGNLDLEIFDPSGTRVVLGNSLTDDETAHIVADRTGTWRVNVFPGTVFAQNRYELTIQVTPYQCVEDAYEPNDTQAQAPLLEPGLLLSGQICADDPDWYAVLLAAGDELTVDLEFVHATGDLNLYLYRSDGVQVRASTGTTDDEQIVYVAPSPGVYGVRVAGVPGAHSAYLLTLTVVDPSACVDDEFEENDTNLDSVPILTGRPYALNLCLGDEDWFDLAISAGDTLTVDIIYSIAEGDLDLQLWGPGGLAATADTDTNNERLVYTAVQAGTHRIRVFGDGPTATAYYALTAFLEGACTDDALEENDTQATARTVAANQPFQAMSCGSDVDWYSLAITQNKRIDVELAWQSGNGTLGVAVYSGTTLLAQAQASEAAALAHAVVELATPGTYHVKVWSIAGTRNGYRLTPTLGDFACAEEAAETAGDGNDTPATADPFPLAQSPVSAAICGGDPDWYSFPVQQGDDIRITLRFEQYDADQVAPHLSNLKIKLYGPPSGACTSSCEYCVDGLCLPYLQQNILFAQPKLMIRYSQPAGTYRLMVYGEPECANPYQLAITVD